MSVKHAQPVKTDAPVTQGKGLDTLDRFIIQNWAPPTRFGMWRDHFGALKDPKMSMEHFLNDRLKEGWLRDGQGAVITVDSPRDGFVILRVDYENKHWTPEAKYNPKHWIWKVVPLERGIAPLEAALAGPLAEPEGLYLRALREERLKNEWDAAIRSSS